MIHPVFVPTGVLFGGALLEILLGGVLSRTAKGWLAFLAAAIALTAVLAMIPASIHGEVLTATLFNWDAGIPLAYHVDGLSILFMLIGTGMGSAILLYSVGYMEEEDGGHDPLLCTDAGVHWRPRDAGMRRQSADGLLRLGAHRVVLLFPGRLLVQATGRRRRGAQGADHDAHCRLRTARRDHASLCPNRDLSVDGSRGGRRFFRRHYPADDRGGDGQVGHVPAAHLDSRGDERADSGFGAAAFGLLCQGGSVSDRPHVLDRAVARGVRPSAAVGRLPDDAGRRRFCHGPERPEAAARLPDRQSARLYRDGSGARHESRHCRRPLLRRQSCAVQRDAVHVRRRGAASHRHARHAQARRPQLADAGDDAMSGWSPPPRSSACR